MKLKFSVLLSVLIVYLFFITNNIFACKVLVDLNTFKKVDINSVSNLKCDGVWGILVNSDLTNNDWFNVYKTLGPGWVVSEDNPGGHSDYDRIKMVAGYVNAAMCYNETFIPPIVGSTQGIGGTILSPAEIEQQSVTHGGSLIVLTRSYEEDGWSAAVDSALKNPMVSGVALECYPNRSPFYLDSLRVKELINACLSNNKKFYFLSPGYNNYKAYMEGYINLLISEGVNFADNRIYLVAASYDNIAPFIGGDESVEGVIKYYLSIEARFASPGNITATLTITGNQNNGDSLKENSVLYDFENGSQSWQPAGTNIDTVYSTEIGQAIPPLSGKYLWLETNATNQPRDYRAAQVLTGNLDLSNGVLVGAVRTWGGLSAEPTGYSLKIKVWGSTANDTISATQNIGSDNWTYFSLDVSKWAYAKDITKLWIGIAYSGLDTNIPSNWIGKMAIDQIGLNSITTTGVESYNNHNLPIKYELSQNYPNPFNPSTEIQYSIPKSGLVTLKVYNMLGQEIVTLVNQKQQAGSYTVNFDASKLASGVYLYRIQAGDFSLTKKMTLLK